MDEALSPPSKRGAVRDGGVEKSKWNRGAHAVTQLSGRTPWGQLPLLPCERGTKTTLSTLARPQGSYFVCVLLSMDSGTSLNTQQPFVRVQGASKAFTGSSSSLHKAGLPRWYLGDLLSGVHG